MYGRTVKRELPRPDTSLFDFGTNRLERCGAVVMVDGGRSHVIVELPNRSPDPSIHFVVWNRDIRDALDLDVRIVGIIHTHPFRSSPMPSHSDIRSIPRGIIGMVYHPSTTSVSWYDHNGIIEHRARRKRSSP